MIRLEHVQAGYPDQRIFTDLSAALPECGAVALMGPSGLGKTTLLRLLAGLLKPQRGSITGLENRRIAFLFQEDRLLPWLTALENVKIVSDEQRAREWLTRMEIEETEKYPREMSGGMQRRVSLARAMAFGGDVLLLDEPFKGLDEGLRQRVAEKIRGRAALTVLSIHDRAEAALMEAEIWNLEDMLKGQPGCSGQAQKASCP